jgi:SAM-dependent MidA family methyltransferase
MRPSDPLPQPEGPARAHSGNVVAAVRAAIDSAGGWIAFERYMNLVLYAPGLGYYVAGASKFGGEGDFVTAPEMTPLFARTLAKPLAYALDRAQARDVLELGAGSGILAAGLLDAWHARGDSPVRYRILEVSPELRARQQSRLRDRGVEWLDALPDRVDGVVLMNEVLDAIAPRIVVRRGDHWLERGVTWDGGLRVLDRDLDDPALLALAQERFPPQVDYASEINVAAEALVRSIGERLRSGALVVVDYGFPEREYYHPQRSEGTLMGHYRHRAHADPFLWPGLSDLTSHVDFTAVALAAQDAGLTVEAFVSLAGFLIGAGIADQLAAIGEPTTPAFAREAAAVNRLTSPAEMGELFKVMIASRGGDGIVLPDIAQMDRAHRL